MFFFALRSLEAILNALTKAASSLEAHVERKAADADKARAAAIQKRVEANRLDDQADLHDDEAAKASRIASRIRSLIE